MKNGSLVSFAALVIVASAVDAAPPAPSREAVVSAERSARFQRNVPNMAEAAASPSNADVGDGDSFGRAVNHLGFRQISGVSIRPDCSYGVRVYGD
jgi:hypothetical protein